MFDDYLSHGWALCKIKPQEKGAYEKGWSTREGAYTGTGALDGWHGGVGLLHAYSGTCAIDIDNFKLAAESLAPHGIDLPGLIRAADSVVWWRGDPTRMKLLYALPEPVISCARNQYGFDFRCMSEQGTSMQDVLPPSIHESGVPYAWLKGDWRDLPPLPPALRRLWPRLKALFPQERIGPKAAPTGAASSLTASAMVGMADKAFEGSRNEWLSQQLYAHLKRGGNYEESLDWLRQLNEDKCSPPEDDDKVYKIWRNKANVTPDPIVIHTPAPAGMSGNEELVIEEKPVLPHGYEWDGDWVYFSNPKALVYSGPLWVERILRSVRADGVELRRMEVMTSTGPKLIAATDLLKTPEATLVNLGIYAINDRAKSVRAYLIACMRDCEEKGKIVDTFSTFGWHGDSFLLGDRLFRPGQPVQTVALEPALLPMAADMRPAPAGSLASWRMAAMDMMTPANMPQAFGFLMGMAAPLMKLSGERGGMYSLLGESGQGKSSVQNALCTVWGDPAAFHTRADDTANARMIKLSYLSNLPMVAEELTKMEPGELSNLAYSVSEGRDKERGTQDGGLRANVGQWHTVVVSSSNRSLLDAILMADGDAAAYRIMEDTVTLPKGAKASEGDRIMRGLVANQGHAGYVFAQYIVDHKDQITALIRNTVRGLSDEVQATTKERIRINMLACAIVAGAVLKVSGVLPLDVKAFRDYGVGVLRKNMGSQSDGAVTFADVLQEFIDKNQGGVLRMKGDSPLNVISIQGRTAPLIMRYDILTEELMVNRTALHKYVQERKQSWGGFKEWLNAQGYLKRESKNILSRGSGLPASPQVNVMVLDNARMGAIDAQDRKTNLTTAAMA